jgi:mRNA interferase RelE/StbE
LKSRYLIKSHRLVEEQDLRELPSALQSIFADIRQSVLIADPHRCLGLPNHSLRGELTNYRALEIDWQGIAYRLVYRIYETPAPKRVVILSFAEHDPAYARAIERKLG